MQRRRSSPERFSGRDVEGFGDASESGNRVPMLSVFALLPRCKLFDDLLKNVRVL